jgi:GTP cyclohydrolase I
MPSAKAAVRLIHSKSEEQPIAPLIRELLGRLGEDPRREGLARTPERVDQALWFLTSGYRMNLHQIVGGALFEVNYDEMVVVKDIEVIGLSKIPRIVDLFARRLQIQERLTQEVALAIQEVVDPEGVGVVCDARHFCMMMRGVEKQHSGAITSTMLGAFRDRRETRHKFLSLVNPAGANIKALSSTTTRFSAPQVVGEASESPRGL